MVMVANPTPRRFATLLLLTVLLAAACAPATTGETATVRPYRLPPLESAQRYELAVYDIEAEPTRVDVTLLPARERDARLFTDLGRGIGDIVTRELFDLGRLTWWNGATCRPCSTSRTWAAPVASTPPPSPTSAAWWAPS